jgi:hypothetical protein
MKHLTKDGICGRCRIELAVKKEQSELFYAELLLIMGSSDPNKTLLEMLEKHKPDWMDNIKFIGTTGHCALCGMPASEIQPGHYDEGNHVDVITADPNSPFNRLSRGEVVEDLRIEGKPVQIKAKAGGGTRT